MGSTKPPPCGRAPGSFPGKRLFTVVPEQETGMFTCHVHYPRQSVLPEPWRKRPIAFSATLTPAVPGAWTWPSLPAAALEASIAET